MGVLHIILLVQNKLYICEKYFSFYDCTLCKRVRRKTHYFVHSQISAYSVASLRTAHQQNAQIEMLSNDENSCLVCKRAPYGAAGPPHTTLSKLTIVCINFFFIFFNISVFKVTQ